MGLKPLIADLHNRLAAGDFGHHVVYGLMKAIKFAGDAGIREIIVSCRGTRSCTCGQKTWRLCWGTF